MEESAHFTEDLGENGLAEAVASGALRQLRMSEIGKIPELMIEESEPAEAADSSLRFDGLYRAKELSDYSYLRFYVDGTVLEMSTSAKRSAKRVARWFDNSKGIYSIRKVAYTIQNRAIEFSTVSSEGTVAYKGQIFDDVIELSSHSYINGHKAQKKFSFVQVALR